LCADDIVFTEGSLSTFLAGPTKGSPVKDAVLDENADDAVQDASSVDEPAKAQSAKAKDVSVKAADEQEDTK
jgi:hypothetical protein